MKNDEIRKQNMNTGIIKKRHFEKSNTENKNYR